MGKIKLHLDFYLEQTFLLPKKKYVKLQLWQNFPRVLETLHINQSKNFSERASPIFYIFFILLVES